MKIRKLSWGEPGFEEELVSQGLIMIPDFINEEEEEKILSNIPPTPIRKVKFRNSTARYGSALAYQDNLRSKIIPPYLDQLGERLFAGGLLPEKPNSISINEYLKGNGIGPHIDNDESGPIISILSILSDADMRLFSKDSIYIVKLPRRSLIQLTGPVRWEWRHSIPEVTTKRYSIVFRHGTQTIRFKKY